MQPPADPPRVAIVAHEPDPRQRITTDLHHLGYQAWETGSAEALYRHLVMHPMDIALVDTDLPNGEAFDLLEHLAMAERYGLIALTRVDSTEHRTKALELGADLYLIKPLEPAELNAGIQAVLRRLQAPPSPRAEDLVSPWRLDVPKSALQAPCGTCVRLTTRETELLAFLMSRSGEVIHKTDLLRCLHDSTETADFHRIESMLYRVRKKASEGLKHNLPVRSVFGRGLTFVGRAIVKAT